MKKYHLNRYLPDVEKVHLAQWDLPKGLHLELLHLPAECSKPLAYLADCYYLECNQDYDNEITETFISRHFVIMLTKEQATELQPCGAGRLKFFLDCGAEKSVEKAFDKMHEQDKQWEKERLIWCAAAETHLAMM